MLKFRLLKSQSVALAATVLLLLGLVLTFSPATSRPVKADSPIVQAAKGKLHPAAMPNGRKLPFFSGGLLEAASDALRSDSGSAVGVDDSLGCSNRDPASD